MTDFWRPMNKFLPNHKCKAINIRCSKYLCLPMSPNEAIFSYLLSLFKSNQTRKMRVRVHLKKKLCTASHFHMFWKMVIEGGSGLCCSQKLMQCLDRDLSLCVPINLFFTFPLGNIYSVELLFHGVH